MEFHSNELKRLGDSGLHLNMDCCESNEKDLALSENFQHSRNTAISLISAMESKKNRLRVPDQIRGLAIL